MGREEENGREFRRIGEEEGEPERGVCILARIAVFEMGI